MKHARRKRILADRYANSNVVRQPSLDGIVERAANFVEKCRESVNGSLDLYVCKMTYPSHVAPVQATIC